MKRDHDFKMSYTRRHFKIEESIKKREDKMPKEICSKCHEDFMNCKCDTYHPNIVPEYTFKCAKCRIEFTLYYKPRFCLWCGAPVKNNG